MKSQSAMEYLMTYGWAILIITVVLGAIYSLGLFNGATLAPKAQPGSCQVIRPSGPGTVQYISLAGSCTNELPQYAAKFSGSYSSVIVSSLPLITGNQMTWVVWADELGSYNTLSDDMMSQQYATYIGFCESSKPTFSIETSAPSTYVATGGACPPLGTWTQFAATYNGFAMTLYVNGVAVGTNTLISGNVGSWGPTSIGQGAFNGYNFNGIIANAQIYNASLDANSIKALYLEGIGGAPINLQNLVGWWPLNQNANDYSGNLYNGQTNNGVIYTNQWLNGYTIP